MNPNLLILIILLPVLALIVLTGAYVTYRMAFYNNPIKHKKDPYRHVKDDGKPESILSRKLIDNIISIPYQNIYVTSYDGLKLRARMYIVDESKPFAIQFHGYKSTPMLDFSGGGAYAMELSMNVIMVDQRACGDSEGRTISFGYNEKRDVISWINFVKDNYGSDRKIILFGLSMGAATVIQAAGKGLPSNVVGVVADCPCSSTKDIVIKKTCDMGLPGKLLYPLVRLGGLIFGGFDPNKAEPKEDVKGAVIPILLIHGEADDFVPCDMSREIAANCDLVEFHTFPGAKHGLSFVVDMERYKTIVKEFCEKCIAVNKIP